MASNTETVLGIYAAFGRGDVAHILDQMSDDVAWDEGIRQTDVAYLAPGRGKDHVMSFFQALGSNLEFTHFEPGQPCGSGDVVMVPVQEAGRNLVTGATLRQDTFVHIWTFDDNGKVAAFRHVGDFAIHEAAARAAATQSVGATG